MELTRGQRAADETRLKESGLGRSLDEGSFDMLKRSQIA